MKNLFLFIIILATFSCKPEKTGPIRGILIYKYTKPEYRQRAYVMLTNNKSRCRSSISGDTLFELSHEMKKGYIVDTGFIGKDIDGTLLLTSSSCSGLQTGICKETRAYAMKYGYSKNMDSIDKEPFLEFYFRDMDTFTKNPELIYSIEDYFENNQLVEKLKFKRVK